jgi:hypothetical protein
MNNWDIVDSPRKTQGNTNDKKITGCAEEQKMNLLQQFSAGFFKKSKEDEENKSAITQIQLLKAECSKRSKKNVATS